MVRYGYGKPRRKRKSIKNSQYTNLVRKVRRDGIVQGYWMGKRPTIQTPRFYQSQYYQSRNIYMKVPKKLITRGFVVAAIQVVPMGRELYIGYTTAKLVYSSWNMIYNVYKNPETLKQEAYGIARDGVKAGLASYQTGLIWNRIEHMVPEPLKPEVNKHLTNIVSNITEEEISLVENALTAF